MPNYKISPGKVGFTIMQRFSAPLEKVWDAATQARHLNKFFTTGAKGNITPEFTPVTWKWKRHQGVTIHVERVILHKSFEFHWEAFQVDYHVGCHFEFSREAGMTVIRISERGWRKDDLHSAFDQCAGWSEYLYGLKAYIQHGIDRRK